MTARVIDFDAFRAEQKAKQGDVEPLQVKVGGKVYDLPPALPATIAVDVIRLNKEGGAGADVPVDMIWNIGAALFGEHFRPILDENQMTVQEMAQLITETFKLYDPTGGKDAAPNRETRRAQKRSTSSRIGRSSKQTSSENTGSTS